MEENRNENASERSSQDLLSTLLSNPDKISKIREVIDNLTRDDNGENSPQVANNSTLGAISDNIEKAEQEFERDSPPQSENALNLDFGTKLPEILSLFTGQGKGSSPENKEQIDLLLAIRPYLSENRKQLIDTFIKFNRISHILRKL